MKKTVVCYKTKNPVYFNKGTKWETIHDTFLAYYTDEKIEKVKKEVEQLNTKKLNTLCTGEKVDWTEIDYFFISEQEEF